MRYLIISLLLLLSTTWVQSQGIEFFHGTWEEALMKAKADDRLIFVDAFAVWCGPCKRMAAQTFPDPGVGEFFNKHFISMKIDMEKEMGLEFRKTYPVSSFPTLFFIDPDGNVVYKSIGAKNPSDFIQVGEFALSKYDKSAKYEVLYEAGDRSYQLVYDYIAALNKAGKPSVKIANDYLAEQKDLTTPENLKFMLEAAVQVDCQCFEYLEKYKSEIVKLTSAEAVNNKIRSACAHTVKRAIEYESRDLVNLASDAMKRHLPGEADAFRSESRIRFALAMHELKDLADMINSHVKKYVKNDAAALYQWALDIEKYVGDDPECLQLAVSVAGKAAKSEEIKHIATYAHLVQRTAGKSEAIRVLEDAMKKYNDPEDKVYLQLKALKTRIENS